MAGIKPEPQQVDNLFQDSILGSISPLQELKPEILPATSNGQLEVKQEDTPVAIGEGAAQDTSQDPYLGSINVPSYGMTNIPPPPSYSMPIVQHTYHNVGPVQGAPERQRVVHPVDHGYNGEFCYARQRFIPGPTQAVVPYPPTHRAPARGLPASENLRQLANHYVQHPGSRVNSICMERGSAGRCKVTIALEVTDFI